MIITIATFCHLAKYGAKCLPVLAHLILTMSQWGNNYPQLTKEESGLGGDSSAYPSHSRKRQIQDLCPSLLIPNPYSQPYQDLIPLARTCLYSPLKASQGPLGFSPGSFLQGAGMQKGKFKGCKV